MPHSYHNLLIHAVFGTKGRIRSLNPDIRSTLFPYMGGIVREMGGSARLINGTEDHVHMLIALSANISVAECMRVVKSNSSRWLHETNRNGLEWQTGYGAFTVSPSNESRVFEYIRNQERHHQRISFEDEFIALLRKHHVDFDERFLWK